MCEGKIITSYDYPPIPSRKYDWSAVREDYDEGDLIGHGSTEQEAIYDLKECEGERELDTESKCNKHIVSKSFYCQREIEGNKICKEQCDHCKEYYAPIERQ